MFSMHYHRLKFDEEYMNYVSGLSKALDLLKWPEVISNIKSGLVGRHAS